jgi:site-specific DNA-methyltransferase (adenine-specific)
MTEINQKWKIGDCRDLMAELEPDSIDLIVTDPPYGYSFMGKDWDKTVPSTKLWKECLRVLKPGAFAFIMSAPRQDVLAHNLVNLSDAGFETGFTSIYWTFASGFPKSMNIKKKILKDIENEIKKEYDIDEIEWV